MAQTPPVQPGQLSPDGMWRWNGTRWEPTMRAAPPRGSRAWIWWLAGGCGLLLVIGLVGLSIGIYSLGKTIQSGGLSCLPKDFPNYPAATYAGEQVNYGPNAAPGDTKSCSTTLESSDDVATVTAFYNNMLNRGDWEVTANLTSSGQIQFRRVSRHQTVGVVRLLGSGQHTEIIIELDS